MIWLAVDLCKAPRPIVTVHAVQQRIYNKKILCPKAGCTVCTKDIPMLKKLHRIINAGIILFLVVTLAVDQAR